MSSHARTIAALPALPLAVQVAFSGHRALRPADSPLDVRSFEQAVCAELRRELQALATTLHLGPQHFIVGLSQMAIGADLLFTEALAAMGWHQRIFLPQPRDEYLHARGTGGEDFSVEERKQATLWLDARHVIEERVVSTARERGDRFDETNLALIAEADVVVCLRREGEVGRPGGVEQMVERARVRGVPLLELRLSIRPDGQPQLKAVWHRRSGEADIQLSLPSLPHALHGEQPAIRFHASRWPEPQAYADALKGLASTRAGQRRAGFRWAAGVIVGTHLAATFIATAVLGHLITGGVAKIALGVEIVLLAWGYLTHRGLHAHHHTQDWAMIRLCAEVGRSVRSAGLVMRSFDYLLRLPMPQELVHVLRTLNVLQLRHTRVREPRQWREELQRYLQARLLDADARRGQIAYYGHEARHAGRLARWSGRLFMLMSAAAVVATFVKLALKLCGVEVPNDKWLGEAAVVFPVAAVGAMSIAAALDTDARAHEFAQMKDFLEAQARHLQQAGTAREAAALASATEFRLLGETVAWYSRRAYTGIA